MPPNAAASRSVEQCASACGGIPQRRAVRLRVRRTCIHEQEMHFLAIAIDTRPLRCNNLTTGSRTQSDGNALRGCFLLQRKNNTFVSCMATKARGTAADDGMEVEIWKTN